MRRRHDHRVVSNGRNRRIRGVGRRQETYGGQFRLLAGRVPRRRLGAWRYTLPIRLADDGGACVGSRVWAVRFLLLWVVRAAESAEGMLYDRLLRERDADERAENDEDGGRPHDELDEGGKKSG